MGYFDTLKNINNKNRLKAVSNTKINSSNNKNKNGDDDDRAALLKLAKQHIDPLDIKTDLLPKDYKPKVPKHIIQRNLEKQAKFVNQKQKAASSNSKNDGNSGMKRDESDIVKQRLVEKFQSRKRQQGNNKKNDINHASKSEPEQKLSFKEMMRLAEVNKNKPKKIEEVKKVAEKKVNKPTLRKQAIVKKANFVKPIKPIKKPTQKESKSSNKEVDEDYEEEENYKPSGFDLLMEEELQSEELARQEDLREARLLKKRQLEKMKLKKK